MSEENVEITRRGWNLWLSGGATADAVPLDYFHEDVEWDLSALPLVDLPTRGRGRDGLMELFARYFSGWRNYRAEVRELVDAGDDVIIVLHEMVSIGDSDTPLERDVFHVYTYRNRRVSMWRLYETRKEALEATGLRE
jgi:ketosteroid isomerase-like protein